MSGSGGSAGAAAVRPWPGSAWGCCSWCGWRECAPVSPGPPELWACDEHWPAGAGRTWRVPPPQPAHRVRPPATASPGLAYWERPDDDPAPRVVYGVSGSAGRTGPAAP